LLLGREVSERERERERKRELMQKEKSFVVETKLERRERKDVKHYKQHYCCVKTVRGARYIK
jgi:ketosteroid isomerase-like protein